MKRVIYISMTLVLLLGLLPAMATAQSPDFQWTAEAPSPVASQAGAVISWEGKLYVLGGYGAGGGVQIWDGTAWTQGTADPTSPYVDYYQDYDACLGRDTSGNPVIDFLGATGYLQGFRRYTIDTDIWSELSYPDGYPYVYSPQIVSMLQHTGKNVCYITGGYIQYGTNPVSLWAYHPDLVTATNLGTFTYAPANLREHFAWWVPWITADSTGGICIGGGRTWDSVNYDTYYDETQCYAAGGMSDPNVNLGPLPAPWSGGGDAWQVVERPLPDLGLQRAGRQLRLRRL